MKFTGAGVNVLLENRGVLSVRPPKPPSAALVPTAIAAAGTATVVTVAAASVAGWLAGDRLTLAGAPIASAPPGLAGTHTITAINLTTGGVTINYDPTGQTLPSSMTGITATISENPATAGTVAATVAFVSISNTYPPKATVSAIDIDKVKNGDAVRVTGTGNTDLDDFAFIVSAKDGTARTFLLNTVNLTGLSGPINNTGTGEVLTSSQFSTFCLTEWNWEREAADAIDVSTFCGAEAIAGSSAPGTVSVTAFLDFDSNAEFEWMEGVKDGIPRVMRVLYPAKSGGGEAVFMVTPSGYTQGITLDEAASFEGEAVVNKEPIILAGLRKIPA